MATMALTMATILIWSYLDRSCNLNLAHFDLIYALLPGKALQCLAMAMIPLLRRA